MWDIKHLYNLLKDILCCVVGQVRAIIPFNGFLVSQLNLKVAEDAGGVQYVDDAYPEPYTLAPQSVLFEWQKMFSPITGFKPKQERS